MVDSFLEALDNNPFEEYPVPVREFVEGEKFLNHLPLSDIQYTAVECMSQIYKERDLARFMTEQEAKDYYKKYTKSEIILQLGKGCHAADTPVYDPHTGNWKPIVEHMGDVQTDNGVEYATEPFEEGYGQLYKFTFANGMTETVYGEHKYLARKAKKSEIGFLPAHEIQQGDRVAWASEYHTVDPVKMSDIDIMLCVLSLATYTYDDESVTFSTHYSKKQLRKTLYERFNGERQRQTATMDNIRVTDPVVVEGFKRLNLLAPNEEKHLPDVLFKAPEEDLIAFVHDAVTHIGVIGKRNQSREGFAWTTLAKPIGFDLAHIIMKLGVIPGVNHHDKIFMYGPPQRRLGVYVDSFPHNQILGEKIGIQKQWRNINTNVHTKAPQLHDGHWLLGIKKIEKVEDGYYYSKTVPGAGHYIGNGPVSANSGKDLLSTIAVSYVVYKLLCLKDPAKYFGQQTGDAIDLINIAINAQQAKMVFFKGLKNKLANSPWFRGKYTDTQESISFIKAVTAYSGHSERESHEGLNLIMAILDEISGFGEGNPLNDSTKSAENIYKAFKQSVQSRYPGGVGKVALLSFPRHREDFISKRYEDVIMTKETLDKEYTYVLNPDLPDNLPDNQLTIKWQEDHILQYKLPMIWAIKRPSWEVNPLRHIEEYKEAFYTDYYDSLQRFACMPTDRSKDTFFRNEQKIDHAMAIRNPISRYRMIDESWKPDPTVKYYVHADLAQKQDKCAVAVAHVDHWSTIEIGHGIKQTVPHVVVDMVAWWEPQKEGPVDLSEVKYWIMSLRERGLDIGHISFDRWNSFDLIRELNDRSFSSDTLSVAKKHYEDLAMMLYEERVMLPNIPELKEEMMALKVVKNKVDHPTKSSKDLSDAVVGAVYNAISRTPRNTNQVITVHTWARDNTPEQQQQKQEEDVAEAKTWLSSLGML